MSDTLQSAQQALAQAGQGQQGAMGKNDASEAEMGQEFKPGGSKPVAGQGQGNPAQQQQSGGGMGQAGIGRGGGAGPQQPLPGPKNDTLVPGQDNAQGRRLSRTYMGTPDPTQDKAAYYSVVPDKIRAAESALNQEEIPAGYKKTVREYFNSIQPSSQPASGPAPRP